MVSIVSPIDTIAHKKPIDSEDTQQEAQKIFDALLQAAKNQNDAETRRLCDVVLHHLTDEQFLFVFEQIIKQPHDSQMYILMRGDLV